MYKIFNKIIDFQLINHEFFSALFKEFETDQAKPDIYVVSSYIDELKIDRSRIVVSGANHLLLKYDSYVEYVIFLDFNSMGMLRAYDEEGRYEIYIPKDQELSSQDVEYVLWQGVFMRYLALHDGAVFIHGSAISYGGEAVIFSALSGTGKSTHARLWTQYYDATYINDDKNFIFFENNELWVYGNPISGKHNLHTNAKAPLKGIVFIEQGLTNKVIRLSGFEGFIRLLKHIQQPENLELYKKSQATLDAINKLRMYELSCTISKEAVDLVKKELFEV